MKKGTKEMKIINNGNEYNIYADNINLYDNLPPKEYSVEFGEMRGFYLIDHPKIEITEKKIYGIDRTNKVFRAFKQTNRNLGVILSGYKGMGKSLSAKMICIEAINQGYPVILVNHFYPGIADFIGSINQEIVVLFDEFDKTFKGTFKESNNGRMERSEKDPQESMLGLFDGIYPGKKLFIVTCNDMMTLSEFLLNRPGRFHYNFRFDFPSADEIRMYMHDNLNPDHYNEIENIVAFSKQTNLNYDALRSIVFELNLGSTFKDAIDDLNIVNENAVKYNITVHFSNGKTVNKQLTMDIFSGGNDYAIYIYHPDNSGICIRIKFDLSQAVFDREKFDYILPKDGIRAQFDYDDDNEKLKDIVEKAPIDYITFKRAPMKNYHYSI